MGLSKFRLTLFAMLLLPALPAAAMASYLDVTISGVRSLRGVVSLCLTTTRAGFPDCAKDPSARRMTVPAASGHVRFVDLPPGTYAISLIHDANGNGRLDTFMGMPREGVGFSDNPRLIFGPPGFDAAAFTLAPGANQQTIKVRYFL